MRCFRKSLDRDFLGFKNPKSVIGRKRVINFTDPMKFRHLLGDESGSAVIEFIILALPLFVPMAIYLTSINQGSNIQYEARIFSREVARVYVTTNDEADVAPRIAELTQSYAERIFLPAKIDINPDVSVTCSEQPCLTPGVRIKVDVTLRSNDGKTSAHSSATQIVDSWRSQ
jgi:Flp pilus assembly protein TadG